MRVAPALRRTDQRRVAARGWNPSKIKPTIPTDPGNLTRIHCRIRQHVRIVNGQIREELISCSARFENDLRRIRRVHGIRVIRRASRELFGFRRSIDCHSIDMTAFTRPRNVRNVAPVGRPGRHEFASRRIGQPARRSRRHVHNPKLVKRTENHSFPIRRQRRPTNESRANHRPVINLILKIDSRGYFGFDLCGERNDRRLSCFEIDSLNFSVDRHDECFAVGSERIAGHRVAGRAGFLVVASHRVYEPLLFTGFKIANAKRRACFIARRVNKLLAVG